MTRAFRQVDVFTTARYRGNPVAVVHDADGLTSDQMQAFANWTNLSETTFLLTPTDPGADYRVRIFTPTRELPFAGHPTLGTCHAWLEAGGAARGEVVVQECGVGLVPVRRVDGHLAFAAPPLRRSGPVEPETLECILTAYRIDAADVVDAAWAENGPPWIAVRLASVDAVRAVRPDYLDLDVGLVALFPAGDGATPSDDEPATKTPATKTPATETPAIQAPAIEVRGFFPKDGQTVEDPVTGSLNASLAQWLLGTGVLTAPYVASQGTVLGRAGRVHVSRDDEHIWVGGGTVTCVAGTVDIP